MPKKLNDTIIATKSDIKRLDKKIDGVEQRLDKKIDGVEQRLGNKIDKLQNTLDGFVGVVDNLRIDNLVGANQISELRGQVDDHEVRITKLESPSV